MSRLADYPFEIVRLACHKCPHKGSNRKAALIARYGSAANIVDLRLIGRPSDARRFRLTSSRPRPAEASRDLAGARAAGQGVGPLLHFIDQFVA